ncbi:DMT family transporter [Rhodobacter sp. NSM]|uniref:DMT family transporter n=1 Tax=Rhodobacter sp. NSM TaxID=3457501 RepID=UPI003FD63A43
MNSQDRTVAAAGFIMLYAIVIGFTDNYVRVIATEAGLWQFHLTRSVMALAILGVAGLVLRLRLRPVDGRAVAARSAIHAAAMLIYFGALAFLPVAQVAAGLFTAPIFVLLISRFVYGERIGPFRIVAVLVGFSGVLLVLGPEAMEGASLAAALPVLAGLFYAMGNIATRAWCPQESAATLLGGFFVALGVLGAAGLGLLALVPLPVPQGPDGFVTRGFVVPSQSFWFWTFVQAAGSLFAVGMMIRAYQVATASRVSVFEYITLPASALWGWILWSEQLTPIAASGMALIALAGVTITLGARTPAPAAAP